MATTERMTKIRLGSSGTLAGMTVLARSLLSGSTSGCEARATSSARAQAPALIAFNC
jgi:hypothetical protein